EVAAENGLRTVAFPSISTGAYRYPLEEAAAIALSTVCEFALNNDQIEHIRFVLFDTNTLRAYANALAHLVQTRPDIVGID
ncbi:MAG TPA: macro domain-containing protein, partial [Spirillospora sp.]|nr:macro domain-containing protein [Spirillospora sp.]